MFQHNKQGSVRDPQGSVRTPWDPSFITTQKFREICNQFMYQCNATRLEFEMHSYLLREIDFKVVFHFDKFLTKRKVLNWIDGFFVNSIYNFCLTL